MTHTASSTSSSPPESPRAVTLVDCDIHPTMTPPMVMARLSTRWRRHYERFGRRTPMITEIYPRARNAGMRADSWPDDPAGFPGSDPELARRQLLDEWDIDYGVLNGLNGQDCFDPPGFAAELNRAVNDWLVEEWMEPDPRFVGAIAVAHDYPSIAVEEIELRAGDDRWVQVIFPASTQEPLGSRRYWPVYEAAAGHGLPVAIHSGGYDPHLGAGWPSFYIEEHQAFSTVVQRQLVSLVCGGVFEAIPDLRIVLTEGGVAWSVALRFALDEAWSLLREEVPELSRAPSEYIRDHVWFTTQPIEEPDDPGDFVRTVELGDLSDRLLFATDYPHWDFDAPSQALPRGLSKEARAAIFAGNACDLYRLPR
jgi:predicted TIM-barrel fold metal-dependent hydrolase